MNKNIKNITFCSFLLAISIILSYVELLIGSFFPIPIGGFSLKIGISNIVTLISIYFLSTKKAFLIIILRLLIVMFLFTNFINFLFSLFGFLFSFIIMSFLYKVCKLKNIILISIYGGVMHNVGQFVFSLLYINNFHIFYILPILILIGVISGTVVGIISNILIKYISNQNFLKE